MMIDAPRNAEKTAKTPRTPRQKEKNSWRLGGSRLKPSKILTCALIVVAVSACDDGHRRFTHSTVLGGVRVSAETLEAGQEAYTHYCRACHGVDGDGYGPSAFGLRPPPRDFTQGIFKFAAVESGALPNDDDFRRVVRGGLHGTAMLAWDVPEPQLRDIIAYIKTFSPKWQKGKPGNPIIPPPDPWVHDADAVERGKALYHVTAQCSSCHPNYATRDEIAQMTLRMKKYEVAAFRDDMYGAVLKESEYRVTLHPGESASPEPAQHFKVSILPPDFTRSELRAGDAPSDLYRTIACGVGGTAMPAWIATAPYTDPNTGEHWDGPKDIWALAHYVRSLVDLRGTPAARALWQRLENQPR
jgi:mono/diheme cytochrome c family protein